MPAHGRLATAWAKGRGGICRLPFMAVPRSVLYGGSGSTQTSLHESVCHVRIGPRQGCGLGNDRLQALPEQTVGADRKAVHQFCQLVRLVTMGGGAYPQGLRPKGAETTMDCPSTHVYCGHAGKTHSRVSEGGYLDMVPGGV